MSRRISNRLPWLARPFSAPTSAYWNWQLGYKPANYSSRPHYTCQFFFAISSFIDKSSIHPLERSHTMIQSDEKINYTVYVPFITTLGRCGCISRKKWNLECFTASEVMLQHFWNALGQKYLPLVFTIEFKLSIFLYTNESESSRCFFHLAKGKIW